MNDAFDRSLLVIKLPGPWVDTLYGVAPCMLPVQPTMEWHRPNIVLLDVGMSTQLTEHERLQMVDLFRAFARLDGAAMARTTLEFSPQQTCISAEV